MRYAYVPSMSSLVQLGYGPSSSERQACVVVVPPHLSLDDVAVNVLSPVPMFRAVPALARARGPPCIVICCSFSLLCAVVFLMYWGVAVELQSVDTDPP